MKTASIHQTPEEQQSGAILSAIQNIPQPDHSSLLRKLEEIKSASLITNQKLSGVSKMEIKGDKGDTGTPGRNGRDGINGKIGPQGPKGRDGKDGRDGRDGKDGLSIVGPPGKDGLNGSPDDPDLIIDKIHLSKKLIDPKRIRGLHTILETVDQIGKNPQGIQNVGGNNPLIIQDSTGTRVSDYVTVLKLSTNITPTYSGDGVVTLTAAGGSATIYTETPTGVIDGANKTYTTAHATTTIIGIWINGQYIHTGEYTTNASGFTMGTALPASLSGTGFTVSYT